MAKRSVPFEQSALDKRLDRKGARKAGVSVAKYEGSPADMKEDAKAKRMMGRKKKR